MTAENDRFNPFPGLRSFEWSEAHLFFGRDGQSDELLRRLARSRFVAVVGTSGSGKSSLVRAGLVPALVNGFMARAGPSWRLAVFRPGDAPIDALACALVAPDVLGASELEPSIQRAIVGAALRRSPLGLIEVVRQARLGPGENLLIVVDQFEEIFRFREAAGTPARDESAAFVKLILEATAQTELAVYVVLTMRSDFLGDCAQFRDLPEALNEGQYLVPRMTRDERSTAITGPVAVANAEISQRLVQRLLNDVGDDPDQLPILQHALMRTWDHWDHHAADGRGIDLGDYEAIGGMTDALSRHADEAFGGLPDEDTRRLAARVFKALTARGPSGQVVRRPMTLARLAEVAGAPVSRVAAVIERFRAPGRSLLMPPASTPLAGSVVVDISHESLIRQWARLRGWVDEETDARAMYLRIVDSAQRRPAGRSGLWRDPDLTSALEWKRSNDPNPAWAALYAPGFEEAMRFLDDSRAAVAAERRGRRILYGVIGACLLAVVATLLGLGLLWLSRQASQRESQEAQRQRDIAVAAREKATTALKVAERERENAETQRRLAEARLAEVKQAQAAERQQAERANQAEAASRALAEVRQAQAAARPPVDRPSPPPDGGPVAQKVIADLSRALRDGVVKVATSGGRDAGNAFFVSNSGWLVTTGQVADRLGGAGAVLARAAGGSGSARILHIDRSRDLALLAATATTDRCLSLGPSARQGAPVVALGIGALQGWSPSAGIVTGTDKSLQNVAGLSGGTGDLVEVTMRTEAGLAGAPVVDTTARTVVGVVAYSGKDASRTYLIPAARVRTAFPELSTASCVAK